MKLYFAGAEASSFTKLLDRRRVNSRLYSYYVMKKATLDKGTFEGHNAFLDCGAFSAFTRGVYIDIDEYISFVKLYESSLKVYASLDVIGDSGATLQNYEYMLKAGIKPLPVFHLGANFDLLRIYAERSDYIALGGMVGHPPSELRPFLDKTFTILRDYWPIKTHGFGVTSLPLLEDYPFYSVDSTSWLTPARFGGILKYEGRKPKTQTDLYSTRSNKMLHYTERTDRAIVAYQKMEKEVTKLWKRKGIVWKD